MQIEPQPKASMSSTTSPYDAEANLDFVSIIAQLIVNILTKPWKHKLIALQYLLTLLMTGLQNDWLSGFGVNIKSLIGSYFVFGWIVVSILWVCILFIEIKKKLREVPADSSDLTDSTPIKGPLSFEESDSEIFRQLQRNDFIQRINHSLLNPNYKIGVLFGESGSGKTSFLRAGMVPLLKEEGLLCVVVALTNEDPLVSIKNEMQSQLSEPFQEAVSLSKAVKNISIKDDYKKKTLIIILDQFEQFFTQENNSLNANSFISDLKALYINKDEAGNQVYDSNLFTVKVLISIRTDFVGRLHQVQEFLGFILNPASNYFELRKFTEAQAARIIMVMAENGRIPIDEDFIEKLAGRQLAGEDGLISPVDIQVLALTISALPTNNRGFNQGTFHRIGGITGLLQKYIEDKLNTPNFFNTNQESLFILLSLINVEKNVRIGQVTMQEIVDKTKKYVKNQYLEYNLKLLKDCRLINEIQEQPETMYQLAHERLIKPIRSIANQSITGLQKAYKLLEQRTNEWIGNNYNGRFLLRFSEYFTIRFYFPQLEWTESKSRLYKASQKKIIYLSLTLTTVVFSGVLVYCLSQTTWYKMNWTIEAKIKTITRIINDNNLENGLKIIDSLSNVRPYLSLQIMQEISKKRIKKEEYFHFYRSRLNSDSLTINIWSQVLDSLTIFKGKDKLDLLTALAESSVKLNNSSLLNKVWNAFKESKDTNNYDRKYLFAAIIKSASAMQQNQWLGIIRKASDSLHFSIYDKVPVLVALVESSGKLNLPELWEEVFITTDKLDNDKYFYNYDIKYTLAISAGKMKRPDLFQKVWTADSLSNFKKRDKNKMLCAFALSAGLMNRPDFWNKIYNKISLKNIEIFDPVEVLLALAQSSASMNRSDLWNKVWEVTRELSNSDNKKSNEQYPIIDEYEFSDLATMVKNSPLNEKEKMEKLKDLYNDLQKRDLDIGIRIDILSDLSHIYLRYCNVSEVKKITKETLALKKDVITNEENLDQYFRLLTLLYTHSQEYNNAYESVSRMSNSNPNKVFSYIYILKKWDDNKLKKH